MTEKARTLKADTKVQSTNAGDSKGKGDVNK